MRILRKFCAAKHAAFFLIVFLVGCKSEEKIGQLSGETMGTSWSISLYVTSSKYKNERDKLLFDVTAILNRISKQMSTYDPESEITQFNNLETLNKKMPVSLEFAEVTRISLLFAKVTKGMFDPTIGPLLKIWGFGYDSLEKGIPSDADVEEAKSRVGWEAISVDFARDDGTFLAKSKPRVLDLSAVAKGYAVDEVSEYLMSQGFDNFLVEIGGDLRAGGVKDGSGWRVAIEKPAYDDRKIHKLVNLKGMSLATSGDYRNYRTVGNKKFSHVINPKTARPVEHSLASVTVADKECSMADGWATTLLVMGEEEGFELANLARIPAYFIIRENGKFFAKMTDDFKLLLE